MFSFLKKHPFSVAAFFRRSIVFTFAVPKAELETLLPECLALDTFNDVYGFLAVALVDTKKLRPKGFPEVFGSDFILVGYRIFVRYTNKKGKRLRGLYILKSETNKKKMEFFGNIFTGYNYNTSDITFTEREESTEVFSKKSGFKASFKQSDNDAPLPLGSPFANWKEARRFAGPLPFTFTYNSEKKEVLIIEGVRSNWTPSPLKVLNQSFSFVDQLGLKEVVLANAFEIKNVPYYWKKGKTEQWKA